MRAAWAEEDTDDLRLQTGERSERQLRRISTMRISYRLVNGEVKREILASVRHRGEERPLPFHQTLLNAHYAVECEQGSRYRSGYPKSVTKRVLEGALARGGAS